MLRLAILLTLLLPFLARADAPLTVRVPWDQSHYQYGAGPILDLQLWGNATDSSGNGYDGVVSGSPSYTTGPDGVANHAINLNGSTQFITSTTLGNFGSYMCNGATMQVWVKSSSSAIQCVGASEAASGPVFSLYLNLSIATGNALGRMEFRVGTGATVGYYDFGNNSGVCDGNWHLVTFSVDSALGSGTYVLDGTVIGTTARNGVNVTNAANLTHSMGVGYRSGFNDLFFTGAISDFRIYQRQISLYEIQALYAAQGTNVVFSGVPNYTNIYATLTNIDKTGATDVSGPINSAMVSAARGSAVLLPVGTFLCKNPLNMQDGVVLRGTGTNTVITGNTSNPTELILFNGHRDYDGVSNILSGYTQGSTNLTFTAIPFDINTGMFLQIQQQNDTSLVTQCGIDGCSGDYCFGQWVRVTGISNNTVQFWPPLYYTYGAGFNPRVRYPVSVSKPMDNFSHDSGVENLVISNQNANANANAYFTYAGNCWLKNVVSLNGAICHVWGINTEFCEIRDSVFYGIIAPLTSSRGYGIQLGTPNGSNPCEKCTADLFENNIISHCRGNIIIGYGAAGNVIGYNYFPDSFSESPSIEKMDVSIHSAHPYANLIEGNQGTKINADDFHGSSSHGTVFRNQWLGINPVGTSFSSLTSMEIDMTNHFYNLVDNVSGYPGIVAYVATLTSPNGISISLAKTPDQSWNFANSWKANMFGYDGEGGGITANDTVSYSSAVFTGNFDYKTNQIIWDGNGPTTFSNSYYLTGQPVWYTFNVANITVTNIPFPAVGADLTPMVTDIPAKVRYQLGGFPYFYPATNPLVTTTIGGHFSLGGKFILQ